MGLSYFYKRMIDSVTSVCFGFLYCEIHLARGLSKAWLPPWSRRMGSGDIEGQQTQTQIFPESTLPQNTALLKKKIIPLS